MAGETTLTIVGNLTADPEIRIDRHRRDGREFHGCFHAARVEPSDEPVRGRSGFVHALQCLA